MKGKKMERQKNVEENKTEKDCEWEGEGWGDYATNWIVHEVKSDIKK